MNIQDMIERSKIYDESKYDFKVKPSDSGFRDGLFVVKGDMGNTPYTVEDSALGQIANNLDIPIKYLKKCPSQLQDTNLNHWLWSQRGQYRKDRPLFVRTHEDRVRAFLSEAYAPISNTEILQIVHEFTDDIDYKLLRPNIDRDSMFLRVVVRDNVGNGNYGFGFYTHNGETGNRTVMISPFIMRTSCTNSTVWEKESLKLRHAWHSPAYLRASIKEYIGKALHKSMEMVEMAVQAETEEIPNIKDVLKSIVKKYKLSDDNSAFLHRGTENEATRMGVVNGITFMSQQLSDPDEAIKFESLAGRILVGDESLFGVASRRYQLQEV